MRVLIWTAYGETDVYCVETYKQVKCIADIAVEVTSSWGFREELSELQELISDPAKNRHPARDNLVKALQIYVDNISADTDQFEEFTFSKVKYEVL